MKVPTSLFFAFLALAGRAVADEEAAAPADSDVVTLTKGTFEEFAAQPLSLIEFYAPWCGHCKALAPEYEKAATELKAHNIPIAKVDCTTENELCEKNGVQGFPTLKVFRKGEASEFKGQRKADSIVSTMKKASLPPVSVLDEENIDEFSQSDKVVVIGYFESTDSKEYKAFHEVAEKLREKFLFGYTSDKAAAKAHSVKFPHVTLFKQFDEKKAEYKGKLNKDDITTFITENSVPLMDDIGPDNYNSYMENGLPLAYLFVSSDEERKEYGPLVEPLAKEYKGKVNFVYIDAKKFGGHAENLNLKQEFPAFAIHESKENLKYPFDQSTKITEKAIKKFVKDYVKGNLKPNLKSEPIPEKNDAGVKVVVGDEYKSIVLDKTKDVLIEFYAPWCGHCKNLAPKWEELGEKLKNVKGIVIAKMDATANDLPPDAGFQIQGFPTIKLVKAGDNSIVEYDGEREVEAFVQFLKDKATNGAEIVVDEPVDPVETPIAKATDDEDSLEGESPTDAHDHEEL